MHKDMKGNVKMEMVKMQKSCPKSTTTLAHEQLAEEARAAEWRVDSLRKKLNWLWQKVYNELNLFKYSHFKNDTVTLRM